MITQKDISDLNAFGRRLSSGNSEIDHEDLVQSALLQVLETGKDISEAKKIIQQLYYGLIQSGKNDSLFTNYGKNETTKFCKCCNEDLPINMFYIFRYKNKNSEIVSDLCKKHFVERSNDKRRNNPLAMQKAAKRALERYYERKLEKEFASKEYLKQAHAILEWINSE